MEFIELREREGVARSISMTEGMEGTVEYSTGGRINPPEKEREGGRPLLLLGAGMPWYWNPLGMDGAELERKEKGFPVGGELRDNPPMAGNGPSTGEARSSGLLMALLRLGELVMGFCFKNL
jgi:hypothetical protein